MLVKVIQFLPAIVFFAAFKLTNNLVMATAVIVGACIICSALEYILTKHISKIQIFMLAAAVSSCIKQLETKERALSISAYILVLTAATGAAEVFLKYYLM